MAVNPTFISSMTILKEQLRLSGVVSGSDANSVIDSAVVKARKVIVAGLGIALTQTLQGLAYDENAITESALRRARANDLELSLVRLHCLRTMPVLFMDNSGGKKEIWNNEGLTRRASGDALEKEIKRLEADIAEDFAVLATEGTEAVGTVQGGCIEPDAIVDSPLSISRSVQGGFVQGVGEGSETIFDGDLDSE